MRSSGKLAAVLGAAFLLTAGQAFAHAELVSSDPAADSAVEAPQTITLTFSDDIAPAFSGFELLMTDHGMSVPVEVSVSGDGKSLVGDVDGTLTPGAYTVSWHIASDDGHREEGELSFEVE